MKHQNVFIVTIILALLAAGCSSQRATVISYTDGIVITGFNASYDTYSNLDPIDLSLSIENEGGTTANNVRVYILGANWMETPFFVVGGMYPPDITVSPSIPGQFEIFVPTLEPYYSLPEGVQTDVALTARVIYDYYNNGAVQIPVINRNEYRMRVATGKEIPSSTSVSNSRGPIHIDIDERGVNPVISTVDEGNRQEISFRVYIKNVGNGAPISGDEIGPMTITLTLQGLDASFTECLADTSYSGTSINIPITLRRGEYLTIPCKANIDIPDLHDTFSILMSTSYTYFTEKPYKVTVIGAPRS